MIKNNVTCVGYYNMFHKLYSDRLPNIKRELNQLIDSNDEIYKTLKTKVDDYLTDYNIDLYQYKEFKNNEYINGELLLKANSLYAVDTANPDIYLLHLYIYAKNLKAIAELKAKLDKFYKFVNLTSIEFKKIISTFYVAVQRRMLLYGEAYDFENAIGMVLIMSKNNTHHKKVLDYYATNIKKKEVISKGLKVYNDVEAAWCAERGIQYDGVDCRQYKSSEYITFCKLLKSKLGSDFEVKFYPSDYNIKNNIPTKYDDIIKHFDNDINKLADAVMSFKKKIALCNIMNPELYKTFIRYEYKK